MEVQKFYWVNGGDGKNSYTKNSSIQKAIREATRSAMEEAVSDLCSGAGFSDKLSIADLGCSSGPNALSAVANIVDAVEARCRQLGWPPPEFQLFLNDLPGNDFNSVFQSLQPFYGEGTAPAEGRRRCCFVAGVPGSFHERLFPSKSVHFFYSANCLHWLSQSPSELQQNGMSRNKGNIYIPKETPPFMVEAYASQFQQDFSNFLKCRSKEMVTGGHMLLTFLIRSTWDPNEEELTHHWALVNQVIMDMVQEGDIPVERVDSFNLPFYVPRVIEVEQEIEREGSFSLRCLEVVEVDWVAPQDDDDDDEHIKHSDISSHKMAKVRANILRAVVESMFASHFGGDVIEDIFSRFTRVLENYVRKKTKVVNIVLSLVRK